MAMEVVRSSIIAAALLFLTLVVLAATASSGGDDAAAAVEEEEHPPLAADEEPYMLVAFHNKYGEEIRMLADKGTETLSAAGFANRSGHWFHAIRKQGKGKRRRRLPLPQLSNAEGLWSSIGALANTRDPVAAAADDEDEEEEERYVLVGMQTSGGDKIRLVAVADQRYVAITGFAKGFSYCPNWFFREGRRHRLVVTAALANDGGSSHAEVVASNLLRGLKTN
ncbi:hypothetical protein BDA96_08G167100 [Sorghum bicolor]|uniref:rRNA N-glycosidase n=2 Tax=Sorghum bicolor TaxID=4558 RepID=A0A921QJ94_SORBI|nr:hypothetical protein BDA96_08G167100 [Sorghum bicolor]OQU79484.1 hypothetical protein SORBI_3008G150500 [Sorghum bicolor]